MERRVEIPEGVEVEVSGMKVRVTGPLGSLERDFSSPLFRDLGLRKEGNAVVISGPERRKKKAMVGTIAAHIRNMILGVTKGFEARLKVVFAHFPMTVKLEGSELIVQNFLGEKTVRRARIPEGVKVEVSGDEIKVSGIDKEAVGLACSRIEQSTRLTGRDRRKFQDGIWITRKASVVG